MTKLFCWHSNATAQTTRAGGRKLKDVALQWEVLSQQSAESNQRVRKSRGRLLAVGVILKWLPSKCSGIDGFKFRPQWPQNDKVRGRRGVRKPLFLEIPIIWLFKSTGAPIIPLTAPLTALRGLHTIIPLTTCVLAPNTAERGEGHKKGVPDLEHTLSITQCNIETWLWVIVCQRWVKWCCQKVLSHRTKKIRVLFFFFHSDAV